ncbi:uncharacterized protein LOC131232426 [Magnolia sinica]|uniref:uncharacterized protein LOC131232426 n=1 Tax=Magnolia sinica TaxID=86752 RepID=UPI00265946B1|nr:uncharacterized protein LOC131232426 [Magnolia sinica]
MASQMVLIVEYLRDDKVLEDKLEAQCLRIRVTQCIIIRDTLYKKGFSLPYLRCLRPDEAEYMIRETHEGICRNHSGGQALARKIVCQGYFWPMIQEDSRGFAKKCDKCQSIPHTIMSDNGKQFDNNKFRGMCHRLDIRNAYSSPRHPQSNDQVEPMNKIIKSHLKTKVEKAKGAWAEELSLLLWTYKTTLRLVTGETPFSLSYDAKAVVPVEIGLPTDRVQSY